MSSVLCSMSDVLWDVVWFGPRKRLLRKHGRRPYNKTSDIGHRTSDKLFTEVRLLNFRIRKQAVGGVFHDDAAGFDDVATVGELQGKAGVLFD